MAFDAHTYRANRARKDAWKALEKARDIKARADAGDAYDWEIDRIADWVSAARFHMRSALHHRKMRALSA